MAENEGARIARLAGRLRWLVWVLILVSIAAYLAAQLGLHIGGLRIASQDMMGVAPVAAVLRHIAFALLLLALTQLAAMLGAIRDGQHFSAAVTRPFRRFALLLFLATALGVLSPAVAPLAAQADAHALRIAFNLRDLSIVIVAGALFLVARLLDQAQRVETTLSEFV